MGWLVESPCGSGGGQPSQPGGRLPPLVDLLFCGFAGCCRRCVGGRRA